MNSQNLTVNKRRRRPVRHSSRVVSGSALASALLLLAALLLSGPVMAGPVYHGAPGSPNSATLSIDSGDVAPGASITVLVTSNLGSETLRAATVKIQYDEAVLDATACTPDPDAVFTLESCEPDLTTDSVGLSVVSVSGLSGTRVLAEITFLAVGSDGQSSALTLIPEVFSAPNGDPIDVTVENGQIDIVAGPTHTTYVYLPFISRNHPIPPCYPMLQSTAGVGDAPHGVAINSAAKRIYVANHEDDTLSVLNSETYGLVTTLPVGDGPNGVAYNAANDTIYVANRNANQVTALRASDYARTDIPVGSLPDGLAVNESTNRVYVANYGSGTVSVINGADNSVQTVAVGIEPSMIAVNAVTGKAYVALHGESRVAVIDGAGSVTSVDTLDSIAAYGIAVDTLRNLVYVATIDTHRIVAIDGSTDTLLGWAEFRRIANGKPVPLRMIAVNPNIGSSGHVFATTVGTDGGRNKFLLLPGGWPDYFGRAYALDLGEPREGIAFEPSTQRVFVTSRSDDLVATYLDGEPACAGYFAKPVIHQVTVCVADGDGTCQTLQTR